MSGPAQKLADVASVGSSVGLPMCIFRASSEGCYLGALLLRF